MMDWKLKGSGESDFNLPDRVHNAVGLNEHDGIKFVVTGPRDFDEAVEVWKHLTSLGCHAQFWLGAAWGRVKEAELVEWILENGLPWKLNVQVHKYIWPADERRE